MSVTVVVGGQAGSEGKGSVVGWLARARNWDWVVRVGGPNAGHTVYDDAGRKWPLRQMPAAAPVNRDVRLGIAAGSEIDLEVLLEEMDELQDAGHEVNGRVWVDETATSLEPRHRIVETHALAEGTSTRKGIGQARAERAMRQAPLIAERANDQLWPTGAILGNLQALLRDLNRNGADILIEGTQGYVLGQHAGYYPDCTSWDCRAVDFLAAVGLAPQPVEVWLVARTYPIRIAGRSGPLPHETSWDRLGLEPEITTVTKRVRRVGEWNPEWVKASVEANCAPDQPVKIALTMVDYWYPELRGQSGEVPRGAITGSLGVRLDMMEDELQGQGKVHYLGTGPQSGIVLNP